MPDSQRPPHPAACPPERLLAECEVRRLRRSGPGGQHRNKVETAVVLQHRPTGTTAEASERRSQAQNQRLAIARLRLNLALAVRGMPEAWPAPSPLWRSRCPDGRIVVSTDHDDFPTLIAEALDVIFAHGCDVRAAADRLGCSASQLVKLLKREPRALALVNARRAEAGLTALK